MKDDFRPNNSKPIMTNSGVPTSATTNKIPTSTGVKPKNKHVEFREPTEKGNSSGKPK